MNLINREHKILNNHKKVIEVINEKLVINSNNQTFNEWTYSDSIHGCRFFDKNTNIEVPKFILFYKDLSDKKLNERYLKKQIKS